MTRNRNFSVAHIIVVFGAVTVSCYWSASMLEAVKVEFESVKSAATRNGFR